MIYTAIDTFYLTDEQLRNSPSRKDDVNEKTEVTLRVYGCELIQQAGILLRLPQAVMATGQVLLHRFFCKKSFARFNAKRVAASCLWLAAKLEENPKKIRDVVNVFHRIDQRRQDLLLEPLEPLSKQYEEMKTDLIRTERHLLKEMGFVCHVEHPHKFILNYLQQLEVVDNNVKQEAWNLANDSLRTTLCVRFKSEVIACGVIYAAARRARIPLPENPPWWLVFDAEKADIDEVCRVLAELYQQPKAQYVEVGKDTKSFVLSTRAWEPPADLPEILPAKAISNGSQLQTLVTAEGVEPVLLVEEDTEAPQSQKEADGLAKEGNQVEPKEPNGSINKNKQEVQKTDMGPSGGLEGAPGNLTDKIKVGENAQNEREKATNERERATNEREKVSNEREKASNEREKASKEREKASKEREKVLKERESRDKGREGDTDVPRDGEREHSRNRDREREKDRVKDREQHDRERERPRDAGRRGKRHTGSGRDRDREVTSHRDKERSRYYPYDRSGRS